MNNTIHYILSNIFNIHHHKLLDRIAKQTKKNKENH